MRNPILFGLLWHLIAVQPLMVQAQSIAGPQPITDLGVLHPLRAIMLDRDTTRSDFQYFKLEMFPRTPPTNRVVLIHTNELLTSEDIRELASGRIVMGVKAVYSNGIESEIALYTFDLRRGTPVAPSAKIVTLSGRPPKMKSTEDEIRRRREEADVPSAPMPPVTKEIAADAMMRAFRAQDALLETEIKLKAAEIEAQKAIEAARKAATNAAANRPLPGGRNRTYADHMDQMADFYARGAQKRRNE